MSLLSPHFQLSEFTASNTATAKGIDNTPPDAVVTNLKVVAAGLETIRSLLGKAIMVSSGYRCPALNKAVGGVSNSAHVRGLAADFTVRDVDNKTAFDAIARSGLKYDQLIFENTWIHIGFDATMRQQNLEMYKEDGKTKYRPVAIA